MIEKIAFSKITLSKWLSVPLTFMWVTSLWTFFKMENIYQAFDVFKILYSPWLISLNIQARLTPILLMLLMSFIFMLMDYIWEKRKYPFQSIVFYTLALMVLFMGKASEDFVYFRF